MTAILSPITYNWPDYQVDMAGAGATQSPYTQPPLNFLSPANNNSTYLSSFSNWSGMVSRYVPYQNELEPQPLTTAITDPYNLEGLTPETYGVWVVAAIAKREMELGRKLSNEEQVAIMNAYRQLAGLPPFGYTVTPDGAVPIDNGESKVLGNPGVQVAQFLSDNFKTVSEKLELPTIGQAFGTLNLLAVAAIVGGIIYLSR